MPDVVKEVVCPYRGAAHALQARAKQLADLIYATKQYIYTTRQAVSTTFKSHEALSSRLSIEKQTGILEPAALNDLLAPDGVRTLLQQLAHAEENIASTVKDSGNSQHLLTQQIQLLNQELVPLYSLLDNNRLGKAQQTKESNLCNNAIDINRAIKKLLSACTDPVVKEANQDPYAVCKHTHYVMNKYLETEKDYAKLGFAEQRVQKDLEEKVFSILQEIPVEYGHALSPVMEQSNQFLREVAENAKFFHALTDWTAFEKDNAHKFVGEQIQRIVLSAENHPKEDLYVQFQDIYEPELEIYHNIRRRKRLSQHPQTQDSVLRKKLKEATDKVAPKRHDFALRGEWYISRAGHLIEFDEKDRRPLSVFDLRKTRLGKLAPDDNLEYGYFSLRGRKLLAESEGKRKRVRKYQFRLPWKKAIEFHETLKYYCNGVSEDVKDGDGTSIVSNNTSSSEEDTLVSQQTSNV